MKKYAFVVLVYMAAFMVSNMTATAAGDQPVTFKQLVEKNGGPVRVQAPRNDNVMDAGFILWGGEAATFYAQGMSLTTQPGSIYAQLGLNVRLTAGDNFPQQVRDLAEGKIDILRGELGMLAMASELLGQDERTKMYLIVQMTWSRGDHLVVRGDRIRTIADLPGKTIVMQRGGPHEFMLYQILQPAGIPLSAVKIVWTDDLFGTPNSPAALFREHTEYDGCFVVSPDMLALTGGLNNIGTDSEGLLLGSKVLVSTNDMTHAVYDGYYVRKDYYDANTDKVKKFVAGFLKGVEQVVTLKKAWDTSGSPEFTKLLQFIQKTYGEQTLQTIEVDTYGLVADCAFVGHPGNVSFFTDPKNTEGFEPMQKLALDFAQARGYVTSRTTFLKPTWRWDDPAFVGYLSTTQAVRQERFKTETLAGELEELNAGGLDDKTIWTFSINFADDQDEFSVEQYGAQFQQAVELASKYGGVGIAVRGHVDLVKTLAQFVKAGQETGALTKRGTGEETRYFLRDGTEISLNSTAKIVQLIDSGAFDGSQSYNPRLYVQEGLNLSRRRAEAVRDALIQYANDRGLRLSPSQFQPIGVGIREPLVPRPRTEADRAQNRRVEFRLVRVSVESVTPSDFDF